MFSEETKKQLELFSGILAALVVIIGKATELVTKSGGLPLIVYGAIFLFGVWMLVKWRSRHSRLLKPDALRLDRDNAEHLAGRAEDIGYLLQQCHQTGRVSGRRVGLWQISARPRRVSSETQE
jgi:hypothetical protein